MTTPVSYARRRGVFSGKRVVMGGISGSGIFATRNVVAQRVGTAGLALGTWIVGGLIALAGAYCYGELGERMPKAGGQYVYLRDASGPLAGFLYAWALLLIMATGAAAFVAVTFANYTVALLGLPAGAVMPLAVGAIVLVCAVNYVGVAPGAITQNIFTILKLCALAVLIVVGIAFAVPAPTAAPALPPVAAPVGFGAVVLAVGGAL